MTGFAEIASGVHVLRYPVLDVNVTLIVGDTAALVVDTLATRAQATELIAAVRRITPAPLLAVNTHHHFDHCFGNATLAALGGPGNPVPIWGHEAAAALLRDRGEALQRQWRDEWAVRDPALADGLAEVTVRPPDRVVRSAQTVDVGGRTVVLRHLGPGHTAGDLVAVVADAGVVVAGDLVEESGPPQFDDAYPVQWPDTLAALLAIAGTGATLVPGHGAPVDAAFARAQHAELAALAWHIRDGHADGAPVGSVVARAPFDTATATVAVRRGYAELSHG